MTNTAKFVALCVCLLAATSLAHAGPSSRLSYAQQCAAEMGTIPSFNCMDGAIIPITKNGVAQSQPVPSEGCDNPIQLGIPGSSQCVPFARFLRLQTGNSNVETVVICRKYHASSGQNDSTFHDIAVIQHNKDSGNTCFFQSEVDVSLDGSQVPSPQENSAAASSYWLEPLDSGPGGIRCTSCHDADPFIWSPYIVQVADPSKWNPFGPWNSDYQNLFGKTVKTFKPDNNCVACHRIGSETCDNSGAISVHEYADKRWMPPGFSGSDSQWHQSYDAAIAQIDQCCNNPSLSFCKTQEATGIPDADGIAVGIAEIIQLIQMSLR